MSTEQIKKLSINISAGVIIFGILFTIYNIFTKDKKEIIPKVATSNKETTEQAVVRISEEIQHTLKILSGLKELTASSAIIFDLPEFKNLNDLSVEIPDQPLGRENPFIPLQRNSRPPPKETKIIETVID